MKSYDVSRLPSMIELGFDGENNWRPNSFDCSALLKNHPDGVLTLWLLPQGESQAFPVAVQRDGQIMQSWELVEIPITDEEALTRYANTLTGAGDPDLISAAETLIEQRIKEEH